MGFTSNWWHDGRPFVPDSNKIRRHGIVAQDKFILTNVFFINDFILTKGRLNSNQNFTKCIHITHIIQMVKTYMF